ncbi:MAG: hypothetical protein LBR41_00590 [Rickettsiales bacterium]|nr:hypothetical protein [Rickettsiales bacterium]
MFRACMFLSVLFFAPVFVFAADESASSAPDAAKLEQQIKQAAGIIDRVNSSGETGKDVMSAASMATTGLGVGQAVAGLAEQKSDAVAARDMAAHTSAFYCNVAGADKSIAYGAVFDTSPPPMDMAQLESEYIALAQSLKSDKEMLGLAPGIESQEITVADDLYAYGESPARTNIFSTAAERAGSNESADKIKSGAIMAAAGVALGMVSNLDIKLGGNRQSRGINLGRPNSKPTAPEVNQVIVRETRPPEQISDDNTNELCKEFPDEPECKT